MNNKTNPDKGEGENSLKSILLDIGIIVLISIIISLNFAPFFSLTKIPFLDPTTGQLPRILALNEAVTKYGDIFPIWNPYLMGGEPFTDASSQGVDSVMWVLIVLFSPITGLSLSYPIAIVLAGVTMYLFARYLFSDRLASVVTALLYTCTGYPVYMLETGSLLQLYGFAIAPLIFLFTIKSFREKNWVVPAIIAGLILGIEIRMSIDMKVTLFLTLIMGMLFLTQLIGKLTTEQIIKLTLIGIIICLIGFGLAAQKILPAKDVISGGSRAKLTYEESSLRSVNIDDFFPIAIQPYSAGISIRYQRSELSSPRHGAFALGFIATMLAIIGVLYNLKNRTVIFLVFVAIICVLVVTASPFFYFLWKFIPPWNSFRYVERGFIMWSLSISLLAGFGFIQAKKTIHEKTKINGKLVTSALCTLLIANVFIFNIAPIPGYFCNFEKLTRENQVTAWEKQQSGIFRVHEWETRGIDWPTDPFTSSSGLEHLYGYTGNWIPQYMNEFLNVGFQSPAKFWGVMNVKYISSMRPINVTGLKLIKTFEPHQWDGVCPPKEVLRVYGPYLYENEEFVSRAIIPSNTILILGQEDAAKRLMYGIMLSPQFNASNTILVMGKKMPIESYDPELLKKFDGIILASPEAISQQSGPTLNIFKQQGGVLMPDILNDESSMNGSDLTRILSLQSETKIIADYSITTYSFEKKTFAVPESKKFLLLSERYFYFEGWEAKVNGKSAPIFRANGFVSAIPLDGREGKVELSYAPKSYIIGSSITILSIFFLLI